MIVGDLKPLEEIVAAVKEYKNVLVLGCGSCVTVCLSGGEREAEQLCHELSKVRHYEGVPPKFEMGCILRQCAVADAHDPLPVIPALNTTFLGASAKPGIWAEMCRGCGDCVLTYTGGICPVARCAKGLFNGPCGGSQNGSCEVGLDTPCAWAMIYYRLKRQNKLHLLEEIRAPKDWRPGGAGGPRKRVRLGLGDGTKDS
jgi:ferredoxin